jgi:hypothetical protein
MLHLSAFEHFKEQFRNKSLVDRDLFGVLVLKKNKWVPTEINTEDFVRYEHVSDYDTEKLRIKLEDDAYTLGNTIAPMWPLVKLIEW